MQRIKFAENSFAGEFLFSDAARGAREFKKPLSILRARYFIPRAQGGHTTRRPLPILVIVKRIMRAPSRQERVRALNFGVPEKKEEGTRRGGRMNLSRHARRIAEGSIMAAPYAARISIRKLTCRLSVAIVRAGRGNVKAKGGGRGSIATVASRIRKSVNVSAWRVSAR